MRKVPTASGARAVQIVHQRGRQVVGLEHLGSAHDDAQFAVLMEIARQRLAPDQGELDLDEPGETRRVAAVLSSARAKVLWDVLVAAYRELGFDGLDDDAFEAMVLARIIEPTSKADTIRVLGEVGAPAPSLRTLFRSL